MKTIKTKTLAPEAIETFEYFQKLPGALGIASACALHFLLDILKREKPKTVLEFGGGMGAISYFCLKYSSAYLDIYENNDFCIGELKKNLKGFGGRYTILTDYTDPRIPHNSYDLIIGDGGPYKLVPDIVRNTAYIKSIFFEGRRHHLQELFHSELKYRYLFQYRKYEQSGAQLKKCAYEIICRKTRNSFASFVNAKWNEYIYFQNKAGGPLSCYKLMASRILKKARLFHLARKIKHMVYK